MGLKPGYRPGRRSGERGNPSQVWFAVLLMAFTLLALGCTRRSAMTDQAPEIQVEVVELQPDPPAVGEAMLVFRLSGPQSAPVTGATVSLTTDMTHAGMVSAVADAKDEGNGLYRTTFEWTMAGDWILTVTGTLDDGRTFRRVLQVNVPGEGG
ncbi:MAG TPA: FixH family protein [Anaerolineales bacterium]|nr:FixH family protein [Anaerolineales bacterium]